MMGQARIQATDIVEGGERPRFDRRQYRVPGRV
jgi:hypothetical protein